MNEKNVFYLLFSEKGKGPCGKLDPELCADSDSEELFESKHEPSL